MGIKLKPIIEKLAGPYATCGGIQLQINVGEFLHELEKKVIKININYAQVIKKHQKRALQQKEANVLKCLKCGSKIEKLLFEKIQLCNQCYSN